MLHLALASVDNGHLMLFWRVKLGPPPIVALGLDRNFHQCPGALYGNGSGDGNRRVGPDEGAAHGSAGALEDGVGIWACRLLPHQELTSCQKNGDYDRWLT